VSSFLKWTGQEKAAGAAFAALMLGCLMVLAVQPFQFVDIQRPLGPWVLLSGFTLAIPAFPCVARGVEHASSGTL
jgi:hypothetical protein